MSKKGYITASEHEMENERLDVLESLNVLDTENEERFDRITKLASLVFNVPISLVSLVGKSRQWFKSDCGLGVSETSRDVAFCSHALNERELLVIENALEDERFHGNPLVTGSPYIRFYAGAVLHDPKSGLPVGSLCIIDTKPRKLDDKQKETLKKLSELVVSELFSETVDYKNRIEAALLSKLDPVYSIKNFDAIQSSYQNKMVEVGGLSHDLICIVNVKEVSSIELEFGGNVVYQIWTSIIDKLKSSFESEKFDIGRVSNTSVVTYFIDTTTSEIDLGEFITDLLNDSSLYPEETGIPKVSIGISRCYGDLKTAVNQCIQALEKENSETNIAFRYLSEDEKKNLILIEKIKKELPLALKANELDIFYQPKIDVKESKISGMEALLRWKHPEHGYISPLIILEAAKEARILRKLDFWVFKAVCSQISEWEDEGVNVPVISINLSEQSLLNNNFSNHILTILDEFDFAPSNINFEILENVVITDFGVVKNHLDVLSESGITFSLDDFGTGYSSLSYLQSLPIKDLKIDRFFIGDIVSSQEYASLVAGIISIAHDLGMEVVAEGVEHENQFLILRALKCNSIQGYIYSKPLPASEFSPGMFRKKWAAH